MGANIEQSSERRIVIVGGGFAGLILAKNLIKSNFQVVLIDKQNFHQFQPLFYQVATSGLEPSSILFPFRKIFQKTKQFHFRMAEVTRVDCEQKILQTSIGPISYDNLIIATGAGNNFFGNEMIEKYALPMKSISESLHLRNVILERFEESLNVERALRSSYLTLVIAGGGPTGVELAGTLAEMKRFVLPKDYPELDFNEMRIILVEGSTRVLSAMSEESSEKAFGYLTKLGVDIFLSTRVNNFDGEKVEFDKRDELKAKTLIWAAGIKANFIEGIPEDCKGPGNRIKVNAFNQVLNQPSVYAVGDLAFMTEDASCPNGHPQLAQVAIQQAKRLAKNLKLIYRNEQPVPFHYKNYGSMATIGRNKAVVELPNRKFYGFFAWMVWMLVHLRSILGIKNKWIVFVNWVWNYFTYNLSLRIIIHSDNSKASVKQVIKEKEPSHL